MKFKPFRIGVIHSSKSLARYIHKISETSDDIIFHSSEDLEHAIPVARKMVKRGIEVIISRKGTAHLLRENLDIPVISVQMSILNLINTLIEAKKYGDKILVPSFRDHIEGLNILSKLIGIHLLEGTYEDSESLRAMIVEAQEQNCKLVVGGGIAAQIAKELDLTSLEIDAHEEALLTGLESARSVAKANRQEKEKTRQYQCIIESVPEGIITFNKNGIISVVNKTAAEALEMKNDILTGTSISQYLPHLPVDELFTNQSPVNEVLHKINKQLFTFNLMPIFMSNEVIGGVATFQSAKELIGTENRLRKNIARGLRARYSLANLKYSSRQMQSTVEKAIKFSRTDSTILIIGETGTGKEILAQGIHNESKRKKGPFVSINCAALPEQLLESELFGYEEGAFTGSKKGGKPGLFEMANKGTILLDEISATSQTVQSHLLRVLEEREIMRIGGNRLIPIDVRVIANSNRDLIEEAMSGHFREDLLFRLNVLPIRIPPLRDRKKDIPLLMSEFVKQVSRSYNMNPFLIPSEHERLLEKYWWPGNVRQLRHFIEQLVLLCNGRYSARVFHDLYRELTRFYMKKEQKKTAEQFPPEVKELIHYTKDTAASEEPPHAGDTSLHIKHIHKEDEARIIQKVLEETKYNRGKAAQRLGICRATLWKKMKIYGL